MIAIQRQNASPAIDNRCVREVLVPVDEIARRDVDPSVSCDPRAAVMRSPHATIDETDVTTKCLADHQRRAIG